MYPLVISLLGAVLLAFSLATTQPRDVEAFNQARADAMATNFWSYRGALVAYQNDNFATVAGFIPDATLKVTTVKHPIGYFPVGYTAMQTGTPPVNLWKNYFDGPTLYTFSSVAVSSLPTGVVDAIANRNGRSMMIGIKQANGTMMSMFVTSAPPVSGARV